MQTPPRFDLQRDGVDLSNPEDKIPMTKLNDTAAKTVFDETRAQPDAQSSIGKFIHGISGHFLALVNGNATRGEFEDFALTMRKRAKDYTDAILLSPSGHAASPEHSPVADTVAREIAAMRSMVEERLDDLTNMIRNTPSPQPQPADLTQRTDGGQHDQRPGTDKRTAAGSGSASSGSPALIGGGDDLTKGAAVDVARSDNQARPQTGQGSMGERVDPNPAV